MVLKSSENLRKLLEIFGYFQKTSETVQNCFLNLKTPKITILFLKQRKTSNNVSDKITSARAITSGRHGKHQIQAVSERFPSAYEDSFKTTFLLISRISKYF